MQSRWSHYVKKGIPQNLPFRELRLGFLFPMLGPFASQDGLILELGQPSFNWAESAKDRSQLS